MSNLWQEFGLVIYWYGHTEIALLTVQLVGHDVEPPVETGPTPMAALGARAAERQQQEQLQQQQEMQLQLPASTTTTTIDADTNDTGQHRQQQTTMDPCPHPNLKEFGTGNFFRDVRLLQRGLCD